MKRFLMYLIVVVVALFLGFTTYYAVQNKESFSPRYDIVSAGGTYYMNVGDSLELPLEHKKPRSQVFVSVTNESIVTYSSDVKLFRGVKGGMVSVAITSENENFTPYTFDIQVGDGTVENPYYISNATQFAGMLENKHYKLIKNIDLKVINNGEWTPLNYTFVGSLDGNYLSVSNAKISTNMTEGGIFKSIGTSGKVENLIVDNFNFDAEFDSVGAIAGTSSGFIGRCQVLNSTIKSTKSGAYVGGYVGKMTFNNEKALINMCEVKNSNISSLGFSGGIAGASQAGIILNCSTDVSFAGSGAYVGGIAGKVQNALLENNNRSAIIKNCLSLGTTNELTGTNFVGAIAGMNIDGSVDRINHYINNYYYDAHFANGINGVSDTMAKCQRRSAEQLTNKDNYVSWDFDAVWSLLAGDRCAQLNLEGYYETIYIYDEGEDIHNQAELISAFEQIRANITLKGYDDGVYRVVESFTYDMGGVTWEPFKEFRGAFVVNDDKELIIKNFVINSNDTFVGFFGSLNGNYALVHNVTFGEVTIDSTSVNIGVIAGKLGLGSTISDCEISGVSINSTTSEECNVGCVAGISFGTIKNTKVNYNYSGLLTKISLTALKTYSGGIIGFGSYAVIDNCIVDLLTIETKDIITSDNIKYLGGIAGFVGVSKILNCETMTVNIINKSGSINYVGGIVGKINIKSEIESCYANTTIETTTSKSFAGGITAEVSSEGTVTKCGSQSVIEAECIGGIVCKNFGVISESYASGGEIKGVQVGGIVWANQRKGLVSNCYTTQSLSCLNKNSTVAGVGYTLEADSLIEYCFSGANLTGEGTKYAESTTEFRIDFVENFWDKIKNVSNDFLKSINKRADVGTINNLILTNIGEAKLQYKNPTFKWGQNFKIFGFQIIDPLGKTFISLSSGQFESGEFRTIFVDNGFSSNIWYGIVETTEGEVSSYVDLYPTLKNAAKSSVQ